MKQPYSHFEQVDMIGKLADLKLQQYHNTLALTALLELMIEKGLVTASELAAKTAELDAAIPPQAHPTP